MMEVVIEGFPSGQAVKNLPTNAGEMGLIPGWGRFPWGGLGRGDGKPLQYSCVGNPMDRGDWQYTVYGIPESQQPSY